MITDTVYRRQKHLFLSPPVTTAPTERFHQMLQDTLRGDALASMPFYNRKKVLAERAYGLAYRPLPETACQQFANLSTKVWRMFTLFRNELFDGSERLFKSLQPAN